MKVFLVILLCSILIGCTKRTDKSEEEKSEQDTAITQHWEKKDTEKLPWLIKNNNALNKHETDTDTVNTDSLLTYEQKQGRYIFLKYCAVCHGELGKGNGFNSYNLNPKPRNFADSNYIDTYSDERLAESIIKGGRGVNKSPLMPSYGGTLNKGEIEYVTKYVRFLNTQGH